MKRLLYTFLLIICATLVVAQNQDSTSLIPNFISKYYVGVLSVNSIDKTNSFQSNTQLRLGLRAEKTIFKNFRSFLLFWYDPQNASKVPIDFRLIYEKKNFSITTGCFPSITRSLHTPNPLTSASQFIPESKNIISLGMKPGVAVQFHGVMAGVYAQTTQYDNFQDSLEFHLGFCHKSKSSWLQEIKVSIYTTNYLDANDQMIIGGAVTAKMSKLFLTIFAEHNACLTYSLTSEYEIAEKLHAFLNLIYQDNDLLVSKERLIFSEIGVMKTSSWREINYSYGLTYSNNPEKKLNMVIQIYLGE